MVLLFRELLGIIYADDPQRGAVSTLHDHANGVFSQLC
jgi:hypothetical protein